MRTPPSTSRTLDEVNLMSEQNLKVPPDDFESLTPLVAASVDCSVGRD